MTSTITSVEDGFAKAGAGSGTIVGALGEGQRRTLPDLRSLGLSVSTD